MVLEKNIIRLQTFSNRGVNGIDGTLGTAIGIAHESGKPTFLLTGELAFLHDSNALLLSNYFIGSLTILLINNQGEEFLSIFPFLNIIHSKNVSSLHKVAILKASLRHTEFHTFLQPVGMTSLKKLSIP